MKQFRLLPPPACLLYLPEPESLACFRARLFCCFVAPPFFLNTGFLKTHTRKGGEEGREGGREGGEG